MITLTELQLKEVVFLETGKRLGFISDLEINENTGYITAIIVTGNQMRGNFFNRAEETIIEWENIVTIGEDVILVSNKHAPIIQTGNFSTNNDGIDEES